ncbi:hypothetical protein [Bradyrhizobium sp.]|uniref:hypothetical protein n=1 Tax=Bradyrhizobium sp. TaxID=376 RepID=UPI003C74EC4E
MSPEDVVRTILDADATGRALDIAKLAHPDFCADLKQRQVFSLKAQSGSDAVLGPSALEGRSIDEARALLRGTLRAVFDVASIEELKAIDSVSFVERVLAALYWSLPPRAGRGELLGVVRRGEEEVHGVIEQRGSAPGAVAGFPAKYPKVVVMTLRKTEEGWRSLLNGGLAITAHHGIPFGARGITERQGPIIEQRGGTGLDRCSTDEYLRRAAAYRGPSSPDLSEP